MPETNRQDFARQFTDFVSAMQDEAEVQGKEHYFAAQLRALFEVDPVTLPVVLEKLKAYEHVNLHHALERYMQAHTMSVSLIGFHTDYDYTHASIAGLVGRHSRYFEGPVKYQTLDIGNGPVTVYESALLLMKGSNEKRLAVLVSGPTGTDRNIALEVMAPSGAEAQQVLAELRRDMLQHSTYRGKTLSVSVHQFHGVSIDVHHLPAVNRADIILQPGVLDQVDRLTVDFSKRAAELKASGRHIKRGLLLYGPPGTGKTYTAMYLATSMESRTTLMLSGVGLGALEATVALARTLAPSLVILEDVDLIAEERSRQAGCTAPLLFELLNQMDGLASDVDIIFLLTTNRPEILEPALASRPGRIDQAIEVPLPDAECRRRLLHLYAKGLQTDAVNFDSVVTRTEGASAAFIKELLRRAALYGDITGETISISDRNIDEALQELLGRGGQLTQSLLGFQRSS